MRKTAFLFLSTISLAFLLLLSNLVSVNACTNFIVTKGASEDGSVIITYAADSHLLYGELYYWAAAKHAPGTMLDIYEWDTGKFLGQIKQAPETYNVVGNVNEFQVAMAKLHTADVQNWLTQPV